MDQMPCGCYWVREPGFGDVLHQCLDHQHGDLDYEGSEPMNNDELQIFVKMLRRGLSDV